LSGVPRIGVDAVNLGSRVDVPDKLEHGRLAQIFDRVTIADERRVDLEMNLDATGTNVQQDVVA
jgi:hypothetical protein